MTFICPECGTDWKRLEACIEALVCPGCGCNEGIRTEGQEENRTMTLKVSNAIYALYSEICRQQNRTPEPGVNFESDDDLLMNIETLRQSV